MDHNCDVDRETVTTRNKHQDSKDAQQLVTPRNVDKDYTLRRTLGTWVRVRGAEP